MGPSLPDQSTNPQNQPLPQPQQQPPNPLLTKLNLIDSSEYDRKYRRLKALVHISLGANIIIVAVVVFLGLIVFDKRLSIFDNLKTISVKQALVTPTPAPLAEAKIAGPQEKSPIFINEQVVSIDKAFNSDPVKIKLTVNGQLRKEVFGYLPYWAIEKADEMNISMLTSVAYFGLEVGGDGEIVKENDNQTAEAWKHWQSDPKLDAFIRKLKQNRTKVLLTFKAFSRNNIDKLVSSPEAQKTFINNVLYQVSAKALDGVNIDFEYVGTPTDETRDGFSIMMSNLNKELKRQHPKAVLTIATFASAAVSNQLWDIGLLAQNSDGLVIMGYDFATPNSSAAGAVAPMGGYGENLLNMINAFLEKAPPEKIILAVPYYGYDWPTINKDKNSQVAGGEVKAYPYAEIVEATKKTTINWDEDSQTPWYTYIDPQTRQTRVVHFENARSLAVKYDFVVKKNLQGIGIWALGFDGRNTDLLQLIADKFAN